MTEPSAQRPVPGPAHVPPVPAPPVPGRPEGAARFAGLAARPVAEHVDVFEAEHQRLQAELGTIDRL